MMRSTTAGSLDGSLSARLTSLVVRMSLNKNKSMAVALQEAKRADALTVEDDDDGGTPPSPFASVCALTMPSMRRATASGEMAFEGGDDKKSMAEATA